MINVCLLGYGAVGKEVFNMLSFRNDVVIKKVFVKDKRQNSDINFIYDKSDIYNDIDLIIDALPKIDPSFEIISNALDKKISVITCNKELIWNRKDTLFKIAEQNNKCIYLSSILSNSNRFYFELNSNNFDKNSGTDPFSYKGGNARITAWDMIKDIDQYKKDNNIKIIPSLEINPILKNNISYSSMTKDIVNGVHIYKFNNVDIKNNESENSIYFKGSHMLLTGVRHYFHYLKEYFGPYLFYKDNIGKDINALWINDAWGGERYHDVSKVIEFTKTFMSPKIEIDYDDFTTNNYKIDELIIIFDGGYLVVDPFRHMIDHIYPKTDLSLIKAMAQYMQYDKSMPEKIYISRRLVSKYLEEEGREDHISRHNPEWLENAIEDYFVSNGYQVVELSGMSFPDQVKYFYNARKIAGQDGAGLINGLFTNGTAEFFVIKLHNWHSYSYEDDINNVTKCKFNYFDMPQSSSYAEAMDHLSNMFPYPILL